MELIHPLIEKYVEQHSNVLSDDIKKIHHNTLTNHPHAHLQSSIIQGAFLSFIAKMIQPKTILEIGTFQGFSTACLAQGLHASGVLHSIELREQDYLIAQAHLQQLNLLNRIILHHGNAKEIIPTLQEQWDLVFIDADKTGYIDYYEMILPQLKPGGWIIADNVLFHGQVIEENISGKNAKAIHAFNQHVANDYRTEQIILTLRDGLSIIQKKANEI